MKSALASLLCILSVSANAGWDTNAVIPSVTNYGTLLAACTQERSFFYVNTNGDEHIFLPYYAGIIADRPDDIVDINLTQGTLKHTNCFYGRFEYQSVAYRNGWLYLVQGWSLEGDWVGKLTGYEVATGKTNILATTYFMSGQSSDWGDDGWLYFGTFGYTGCQIERYNPDTQVHEQLGNVDTNNVNGNQYAGTIGADSRYCYTSIRNANNTYYLGSYDTVTGVKTNWFHDDLGTSGYIYRGRVGGWYYERNSADWYALSNGVPNSLGTLSWFYTNVFYIYSDTPNDRTNRWRGGVVTDGLTQTNSSRHEFDMTYSLPDSSNNVATIGYKTLAESDWHWLSTSNFTLAAASISKAYPDGTNMFVISGSYLPWFGFNPATAYVTRYGAPFNAYGAINRNSLWYVVGYDAATYEFDSSLPWTQSFSTPDPYSESVNPHRLNLLSTTHEMYPCFGSDGLLYVCSLVARGGNGTKFGWYDLVQKTNQVIWPFTTSTYQPSDLQAVNGGTNLVFLPFGTPKLMVFNVPSRTWTQTNSTILPELTRLDKCVEVSDGILVGVAENRVWKYNVATDTVLFTNALPGTAWSGYSSADSALQNRKVLTLGPDGYVWVTLGSDLYRIHPSTCAPELIKTNVGAHNVVFNGGDAYLYNPATTELHSLLSLLVYTSESGEVPAGTVFNRVGKNGKRLRFIP